VEDRLPENPGFVIVHRIHVDYQPLDDAAGHVNDVAADVAVRGNVKVLEIQDTAKGPAGIFHLPVAIKRIGPAANGREKQSGYNKCNKPFPHYASSFHTFFHNFPPDFRQLLHVPYTVSL
jgi:hypothetical protein